MEGERADGEGTQATEAGLRVDIEAARLMLKDKNEWWTPAAVAPLVDEIERLRAVLELYAEPTTIECTRLTHAVA